MFFHHKRSRAWRSMDHRFVWRSVAMIFAFPVLLVVTLPVLHTITRQPMSYFTRDPAAVLHGKFYVGLLSNTGIVLWAATTAITLLGASILHRSAGHGFAARFLRHAGLLSLILMLDDLLQFHETVFPVHLRIPEKLVLSIYAVLALTLLVRFWPLIIRSRYVLLLVSAVFLSMSVVIDLIYSTPTEMSFLFEDGFKLLGITGWTAYYWTFTLDAIGRHRFARTIEPPAQETEIRRPQSDAVVQN
jgi:hypothetical protein